MVLVIDNYDSFTYNLVEYYRKKNLPVLVYRNNEITIDIVTQKNPSLIIISPGPKNPEHVGIVIEIIQSFSGRIPIFGVCLGCQSIAYAYGAKIVRAEKMYHGKTSVMTHQEKGILKGVRSPMEQMRYHSLVIDESTLPDEIEITARSADGEIMAIRHIVYGIEGVQFHPESIASVEGNIIMDNALRIVANHNNHLSPPSSNIDSVADVILHLTNSLLDGEHLSKTEAMQFMEYVSEGSIEPEVIAMLLTSLRLKGETAQEIAGIAEVARSRAVTFPIERELYPHLIDIVGTGGDKSNTFNISTAAAIVAAGAGATVAKHGNRAVSSLCGSADVLEALGVNITAAPSTMSAMLKHAGMCFLFAPLYHPSMKNVATIRKKLKIRTVFNILGPLVNPALVPNIVLGVYDKSLMPIMAQALVSLGIRHGLVVHSNRQVDEITLQGTTYVLEIKNGMIQEYFITPKEYFKDDLIQDSNSEVSEDMYDEWFKGGDAQYNAVLIEQLLMGSIPNEKKKKAIEQVVSVNAGAALYVAGNTNTIKEGISLAYHSLSSGKALQTLQHMRAADK